MMTYRPIDIARKLNISTSSLRFYEDDGIVPKPERTASGYRIYTAEHLYYFQAIRSLSLGFGYQLTHHVMLKILEKDMLGAFWLINDSQANLNKEKKLTDRTLEMLTGQDFQTELNFPKRGWFTIGEVADKLNLSTTALRHWCLEGLITPEKDLESGYRMFTYEMIQKVLLIRVIKTSTWSLNDVRTMLTRLDHHSPEKIVEIAKQSLRYINQAIQRQLVGIHYLYVLCHELALTEIDDFPPTTY
ncbi:MerR family DNA-binding transcriptional regulator [uncultured Vagococcus sp.]|uniref:MerR family DNA-binding transcriptional regulator n=1 Tax=uncultured Vagococcus sp. TaxID=189676 RepID=UPI0028D6BCF7|nr:MerR family DNA-binding transcriptional regulator [uncultured Vagococcus sp.]